MDAEIYLAGKEPSYPPWNLLFDKFFLDNLIFLRGDTQKI
jgi:hypothetical protein